MPIESAVANGGDTGEPVALIGTGAAAQEFRAIAQRIISETIPVAEMAGCSARVLDAVEVAVRSRTS